MNTGHHTFSFEQEDSEMFPFQTCLTVEESSRLSMLRLHRSDHEGVVGDIQESVAKGE